jgi:hypothetical protein
MLLTYAKLKELIPELAEKIPEENRIGYVFALDQDKHLLCINEKELNDLLNINQIEEKKAMKALTKYMFSKCAN